MNTTNLLPGQVVRETQDGAARQLLAPHPAMTLSVPIPVTSGGATTSPRTMRLARPKVDPPEGISTTRTANVAASPKEWLLSGSHLPRTTKEVPEATGHASCGDLNSTTSQTPNDSHERPAGGGPCFTAGQRRFDTQSSPACGEHLLLVRVAPETAATNGGHEFPPGQRISEYPSLLRRAGSARENTQ